MDNDALEKMETGVFLNSLALPGTFVILSFSFVHLCISLLLYFLYFLFFILRCSQLRGSVWHLCPTLIFLFCRTYVLFPLFKETVQQITAFVYLFILVFCIFFIEVMLLNKNISLNTSLSGIRVYTLCTPSLASHHKNFLRKILPQTDNKIHHPAFILKFFFTDPAQNSSKYATGPTQ